MSLKKIKPYKGKVDDNPAKMQTKQLIAYMRWCEEYLDWCLDDDGRVNAYDRMAVRMEPYQAELRKRGFQ